MLQSTVSKNGQQHIDSHDLLSTSYKPIYAFVLLVLTLRTALNPHLPGCFLVLSPCLDEPSQVLLRPGEGRLRLRRGKDIWEDERGYMT